VHVLNDTIHHSHEFDCSDNNVITNINNKNIMHFYGPSPRSVDGVLYSIPI